jgi:prophage maintenance system killer protein
MSALLIGYARCATDAQDLTAQRDALGGLGVAAERIYVDLADKAAVLVCRLARNHPLPDGNKRAA